MTVPLLAKDYADYEWPRLGLTHPFIAPYGVYQTADKVPVLISIQNDREFERLCHDVLDHPGLEKDPDYATNKARNARRDDTNAIVQKSFGARNFAALAARLDAAQIAWARVSSVADLSTHPQLRRTASVAQRRGFHPRPRRLLCRRTRAAGRCAGGGAAHGGGAARVRWLAFGTRP